MDRFDALTAFLAVADHGSFVAAARELGQSPASITRQIASLERTFGTSLFHRSTRSVVLSHEGAALVERARGILSELREAERTLKGGNAEPVGDIQITAPVMYGRMHVLPVVCELMQKHPQLNVRMMLTDRNIRLVEEGIDIAVRIGEVADTSLLSQKIGSVRRIVVASPDYLTRRGEPGSITELEGHDLIQNTSVSPGIDWQFLDDKIRSPVLSARLSVNSLDAAIAAAKAGAGLVSVLDYQVREELARGELVMALSNQNALELDVRLMYLRSRASIAGVRAFLDAMKAAAKA